jgi:hypothetical protein
MIELADQGNATALAHVKSAYKAAPSIVPTGSLLQQNAERAILASLLQERQPYARMMIERELEEMRTELAGEYPSALERLLVDRVVLCWLDATIADTVTATRLSDNVSLAQGQYYAQRSERAQRNFLRAVRTLAMVRRLGAPVLQLNVGAQQVNVTG